MPNNKFQKSLNNIISWTKKHSGLLTLLGVFICVAVSAFQIGHIWGKNASIVIFPPSNDPDKSQNCDSYFKDTNDARWEIDKYWERSKDNPQYFLARSNKKLGGPSMKYYENVSDNFRLKLVFKPITDDEINIVIYIGNFYKLVLGDGNKDAFYLERDDQRIPELGTEQEEIKFLNRIKSNELVTLEINQSVPDSYISGEPIDRTIVVSLFYTPDEIENARPVSDDGHVFQISDKLPPSLASHKIRIGLLYSENNIITEFYCFKLEK